MSNVLKPIKTFFERKDAIAPNGGKRVTMKELKDLSSEARHELADLAREELGAE